MKTICIYEFSELNPEAKELAIESVREEMESNEWHEAYNWAVDDCALFEPKHEEMVKACGDNYYEENRTSDGKYGQFVFKNRRKIKSFDPDPGATIILGEALEITNDRMFKLWLGIPEIFHESVEYRIGASIPEDFIRWSKSTTIEFEHNELNGEIMGDVLIGILELAKEKFDSHISDIHDRILTGIDAYFDDENVEYRIEEREYEFLEDGSIWNS
jgi:hypothetical protein